MWKITKPIDDRRYFNCPSLNGQKLDMKEVKRSGNSVRPIHKQKNLNHGDRQDIRVKLRAPKFNPNREKETRVIAEYTKTDVTITQMRRCMFSLTWKLNSTTYVDLYHSETPKLSWSTRKSNSRGRYLWVGTVSKKSSKEFRRRTRTSPLWRQRSYIFHKNNTYSALKLTFERHKCHRKN